jgi:hypothetical protein
MDRHDEMAACHRRIAEAHSALLEAHVEMAQLLEGHAALSEALSPAPVAAAEPVAPARYRAADGNYITAPEWRHVLITIEDVLRATFGSQPFKAASLRDAVLCFVVFSAGDLELYHCTKTPRWWATLQFAVDCVPSVWPSGRAVIARTNRRGYYQLAAPNQ